MLNIHHFALWCGAMIFLLSACSSSEQPQQAEPAQEAESAQEVATSQPAVQPQAEPAQEAVMSQPDGQTESVQPASAVSQPPAPKSQPMAPVLGAAQAKVTASVVTTETSGATHICTLKVQKVHGYGPGSKPLPTGREIRVVVKNAQIQQAGDKGQKLLQQGSVVEVTMRFQKPMAITPPPPEWSLLEIH